MDLVAFFQWCENSGLGRTIRNSVWLFPAIEAIHLLGLAVIGGAVLIVDLRLARLVLKRQQLSQLAIDVQPWLIGSLLVMLVTGFALFASEAMKCYSNGSFWLKMISLFLAIVFTFTVRRKVLLADESQLGRWGPTIAFISIMLWSGVGIGGRGIGFY